MAISAIGPNFQGRRDNIDAMINMDDESVRRIAYLKTASRSNEKKHNRIINGLIIGAPVAAGVAAAVLTKGKSKIFSTTVSGTAARLANGLKEGGSWAAGLAAVGVVGLANSALLKNSKDARKLENEHPFLSLAALIAVGLGAISLTNKGLMKLGAKEAPKFLQKAVNRISKSINNSKYIGKAKDGVKSLLAKTPAALKDIGATALAWSPSILLLGGLFHSIGHDNAVKRDFSNNYSALKERQLNLAQARNRELSMENDFLKTDAQNREDLALVKNPLKDLSGANNDFEILDEA